MQTRMEEQLLATLRRIAKSLERMEPENKPKEEVTRFDKSVAANRRIMGAIEYINDELNRMRHPTDLPGGCPTTFGVAEVDRMLGDIKAILLSKHGTI